VTWLTPRGYLLLSCHAFQLGLGKLAQRALEMLPRDCKPVFAIAVKRLNGAGASLARVVEIVCECLCHLFSLDCVGDKDGRHECEHEEPKAGYGRDCL
jgi:hypothetical protein